MCDPVQVWRIRGGRELVPRHERRLRNLQVPGSCRRPRPWNGTTSRAPRVGARDPDVACPAAAHHAPTPRIRAARRRGGRQPAAGGAAGRHGCPLARYFFFGPAEISAMRGSVVAPATVFEILAAAVWRCRTAALGYAPGRRVRFVFTSNARRRGRRRDATAPAIPRGYYSNALVFLAAEATAGELRRGGLRYALQLVRRAKLAAAGGEHLRSTVDLLARRGWPAVVADRTYVVSDVTAIGEDSVDFGWGRRAGGGILMAGDIKSKLMSCFTRCKNAGGEDCTVVPMYLPRAAMDRFAAHIAAVCSQNPWNQQAQGHDHFRSFL
ncbi:hypothetical protein ACP70R_001443 [Stipagrostis hirtigluma subsp. patula]